VNVYMYQAALWCEACGEKLRAELLAAGKAPADPEDECSYDSDDFPKGPEDEGETDSPSHCDGCGVFLESPLTDEGTAYVRDAIENAIIEGREDSIARTVWGPHYGIEPEDPRAVRLARLAPNMRELADPKDGTLPAYAWPGGYPMFYVTSRDEVCCTRCANDPATPLSSYGDETIVAGDANWENPELYCECGDRIESAYAEDDAPKATEGVGK